MFGLKQSFKRSQWRILGFLRPKRKVKSRGLEFSLRTDTWINQFRWKTFNDKEPEMLDWIDQTMKNGDTFFDIGANVGIYSIYAAKRHSKSTIVSFEPEYANLTCLRDNTVLNGLQTQLQVYGLALSNKSGISYLNVQDLTPGAALHSESKQPLKKTFSGKPVLFREGIYSITLDEFCQQSGLSPNCIKIDVDGTETEILEGAKKTLSSSSLRSIIIELDIPKGSDQTVRPALEKAGFKTTFQKNVDQASVEVWTRQEKPQPVVGMTS